MNRPLYIRRSIYIHKLNTYDFICVERIRGMCYTFIKGNGLQIQDLHRSKAGMHWMKERRNRWLPVRFAWMMV